MPISPDAKYWTWVLERQCPECGFGDGWDRPGRRSDGAAFTVESIGRYYLHDIEHRTWDVNGSLPSR